MDKRIFVAIEKNSFVFSNSNRLKRKLIFNCIKEIPNVPFFHHLLDADKPYLTQVTKFLKKELALSNIFKYVFFVILPDDTSNVELKSLIDLFMSTGLCKKVITTSTSSAMLNRNEPKREYIALTKTERNLIINCFIKDKTVEPQFVAIDVQDLKSVKNRIKSLSPKDRNIDIVLYGEGIELYKSLGNILSVDDVLSNFKFMDDFMGKI